MADQIAIAKAIIEGRRLCLEAWPEADDGEYNPQCCRFPKPCSIWSDEDVEAAKAVLGADALTKEGPR